MNTAWKTQKVLPLWEAWSCASAQESREKGTSKVGGTNTHQLCLGQAGAASPKGLQSGFGSDGGGLGPLREHGQHCQALGEDTLPRAAIAHHYRPLCESLSQRHRCADSHAQGLQIPSARSYIGQGGLNADAGWSPGAVTFSRFLQGCHLGGAGRARCGYGPSQCLRVSRVVRQRHGK
jgi:hypothetical protein